MAERRHRRRVCIRASTIVAVRGGSVAPAGFRGGVGPRDRPSDRAGARGLPARLHGDGGIDARTYRALRPGRPRRPGRPGSRSPHARGSGASATGRLGLDRDRRVPRCSSSPRASTRARPSYPRHEHIVTAGKYVEYALLAPAAALIVRRAEDFALLVFTLVASSVAATALGVVQFLGWRIVHALDGRLPAAVVPRPSRLRGALRRHAGRRARRDRAARRRGRPVARVGGRRRRRPRPPRLGIDGRRDRARSRPRRSPR